jgi:hypothetical protein
MQIDDLELSHEFSFRVEQGRQPREPFESLQRMARIFAQAPERMLQDIADAAIELCNADSAGVSVENSDGNRVPVFHWVAASGQYAKFRGSVLPKAQLPCRISLETMRAQHIRVPGKHFAAMGIAAEEITDGISVPWSVEGIRGTVWIVAHKRSEAFDRADYQIMQSLAQIASAVGYSQRLRGQVVGFAKADAGAGESEAIDLPSYSSLECLPDKAYLFRLTAPPRVCLYFASACEVYDDQLVLLNRKGDLVALIVLEAIEGWCEVNDPFRSSSGQPTADIKVNRYKGEFH